MLRWLTAVAGLLALGCSTSGVVQTALYGDLATLKRQIRQTQQAGELDQTTAVELARAVAARELRSSQGEAAVRRIQQVRACAHPLVAILRDRARRLDEAGAEATMLLLETNREPAAPLAERYADATDGAWRAVAARAALAPRQAELRRRFMVDHDERVRRAALRAALAAGDTDDLELLLEASRLDPDPVGRSLAARAAGGIGGARVALALKDYWARADETTRLSIVQGWAMPATFGAGGREALVWVAETQGALPAIAAADALVSGGEDSAAIGTAVLLRSIREGTREERRLAVRLAPLHDPEVCKELKRAWADPDREVRVMALARLLYDRDAQAAARSELRKLARGRDRIALQAGAALAAAGDGSVSEQLRRLTREGSSHRRRVAALALLRLGLYSAAATALADDDPSVRTAVACAVLNTAQ
jgi:hypothetical protein